MKNSYITLLAFLFLLIGQRTWGENVTRKVHFNLSELKCDTITGGDGQVYNIISFPDLESEYNLGFPSLPVKYVSISLPYIADNISLSVKPSNVTTHTLNKVLFPVQEPEPTFFGNIDKRFIPCEKSVYESALTYPSEPAKITEISCAGHGDRHVVVAVYPVVYHPTNKQYDFHEVVEFTVSYGLSAQKQDVQNRNVQMTDIGIPFYEYCVITSQSLKDAFTRLIAWKREKGLNAGVVCKEEILNNAYIVGDTVSHLNDDAGKIRQYLQYAYASGITKYVLFGGNDQVLPIRYGTGADYAPNSTVSNEYNIPSDLYFSELNSKWGLDGDNHLGEPNDISDYGSELYVGRILCTNAEEIYNYTDKLLRYELYPGNGDFSYLKKALYTQCDEMQNGQEQEQIRNQLHSIFPTDTIFSENPTNNPTSPYGNDVIAEMNNHYGYVSWGGHGHPNAIKMMDGNISGYVHSITSVQGHNIPFTIDETANGLDNLTNKYYPMFTYSTSCTITPFDIFTDSNGFCYSEFPNIGQSFTLGKNYGGPILVGNTRYGWVGSSKDLQMKFNEYIINDPMVGAAQNYAKMNHYNHFLRHSSNIIGCPEIRIWTDTPSYFNGAISYSSNNCIISANTSIMDSEIGIRDITQANEVIDVVNFNPSQGSKTLTNVENCLLTLTGKNCLPQIMPLTIQNDTLQGTHHLIVKDVTCGKDVRNGTQGNVIFDYGSDYTFESEGTFKLTKGVTIKRGAKLKVAPSEINY